MLAWLSVWSDVQICIWPSWCHCHSLSLASVKSRLVFTFLVPAHLGSHGQRAVKRVCLCRLWTLEDRRVRADLVEVYKIIHGFSPVSFDTFFEFSHNSNTTKRSLKLHKRRVRTDLRQHFFTERVIKRWNSLDEESVSAVSVNSFKRNWCITSKPLQVYMTPRAEPDLWRGPNW